jgi:nicotinamidase/pyrazinamidase
MKNQNIISALVIIDMQNDFVEGGTLEIIGGKFLSQEICEFVNNNHKKFVHIYASRDWHIDPGDHFKTWKKHCIANTKGAEFTSMVGDLINRYDIMMIDKGMFNEGYSAASGIISDSNIPFLDHLLKEKIENIYICGIAIDYCVKETAIELKDKTNSNIFILENLTLGVSSQTSKEAFREMKKRDIRLISTS